MKGVRTYFQHNAPPGTRLASRSHVIAKGETLSQIAQRYRVSVNRLRLANNLPGDRIRPGQVLKIPLAGGG